MSSATATPYGGAENVACHGFPAATFTVATEVSGGSSVGGLNGRITADALRRMGGYGNEDYAAHTGFEVLEVRHNLPEGTGVIGSIVHGNGKALETTPVQRMHLIDNNTLLSGQFATSKSEEKFDDCIISVQPVGPEQSRSGAMRIVGFPNAVKQLAENGREALTHDFLQVEHDGTKKYLIPHQNADSPLQAFSGLSIGAELWKGQSEEGFDGLYKDATPVLLPGEKPGDAHKEYIQVEEEHAKHFADQLVKSLQPQDVMHVNEGLAVKLKTTTDPNTGEYPEGRVYVKIKANRVPLHEQLFTDLAESGVTLEAHPTTGFTAVTNTLLNNVYGNGGGIEPVTMDSTQESALAGLFEGAAAADIKVNKAEL